MFAQNNLATSYTMVVLACLLVATVASPLPQELGYDDDDVPVYTEKVVPTRATAAPKQNPSPIKASRFSSKKLRALPKPAAPASAKASPLHAELPRHNVRLASSSGPKSLRRAPKLSHDIKPDYHSSNPERAVLKGDYAAPQPAYAAPQTAYAAPKPAYAAPQTAYAAPKPAYAAPHPVYRNPNSDYKADAYEQPQPYAFGYDTKDDDGNAQFRQEDGDDYGNKRGSYGYTDAYGVYRQVNYVADEHGFRASIKTNEPGTDNQNPADVQISSDVAPAKYDNVKY